MRSFSSLHTGSGDKSQGWLIRLIWISAAAVLLGRAWQHIFLDVPYRALLWNETLMKPIIWIGGWKSWDDYIISSGVDHGIDVITHSIGGFLLFTFFITLFWRRMAHWLRQIFWITSGVILVILAFCYFMEKFYVPAQFFEYSLQFGSVLLLWSAFRLMRIPKQFILLVKLAIAFTFVSHGLYAIGLFPRPGHFVEMCIHFFGLSEEGAIYLLWVAGLLDFVAAALLFFPRKLSNIGLVYCVIWGAMTAFARITANFYGQDLTELILHQVPETLYRFPHFLVPLGLLLWQWKSPEKLTD